MSYDNKTENKKGIRTDGGHNATQQQRLFPAGKQRWNNVD